MDLFKYFAVEKALNQWKITKEQINKIEQFFAPYLGYPFVLVPRFNGDYISFRYCGLEVLRLTKKGTYKITIEKKGDKILGIRNPKTLQKLEDLEPLVKIIEGFAEEYKRDFTKHNKKSKQERTIPGFQLEHWLESIILSECDEGERARKHLGINTSLKMVISQVPIILLPSKNSKVKKNRRRNIDILSFDRDGTAKVVELKKDNNLKKAKEELRVYTDWLMKNKDEFHPERGCPEAMVEKHYLPADIEMNFTKDKITAIAVIKRFKESSNDFKLDNGITCKVVNLPENWLIKEGCIF